MIKVWVLVFSTTVSNGGGPAVIDNIASKQECQRLAAFLDSQRYTSNFHCVEVWKVSNGR